jgi:hypothetical protein
VVYEYSEVNMSFVEDLKKDMDLKSKVAGSYQTPDVSAMNTAAQAAPKSKAKFTQEDVEAIVAKAVAQTLAKVQANQVIVPPATVQDVPLTHWHVYGPGKAKDGHQYTAGCSWYATALPMGSYRKSKGISIDAILQILLKYGGNFAQLEKEWTEGAEKYGKMSYVYQKTKEDIIDLSK